MALPKLAPPLTQNQLDAIILEGVGNGSVADWMDRMLLSIGSIVAANPSSYLSFGPMWWPIKKLLLANALISGQPADDDLVAQATLGKPEWDIAAAFAFHEHYQGGNLFTVMTDEGGAEDYTLVDEDFEGD